MPALYGEVYEQLAFRPCVARQATILFVSLQKLAERTQYAKHFEEPDAFVFGAQLSTKPTGMKSRENRESLSTGKSIDFGLDVKVLTSRSHTSGGWCR